MVSDSIDIKHILYIFVYDTQYWGYTDGGKSAQNPSFSAFLGILSLFFTICIAPILSIINKYIQNMLYINGIPYHMNSLGLKSAFQLGKSIFSDFFEFSYTFPIKMFGNRQVAWGGLNLNILG